MTDSYPEPPCLYVSVSARRCIWTFLHLRCICLSKASECHSLHFKHINAVSYCVLTILKVCSLKHTRGWQINLCLLVIYYIVLKYNISCNLISHSFVRWSQSYQVKCNVAYWFSHFLENMCNSICIPLMSLKNMNSFVIQIFWVMYTNKNDLFKVMNYSSIKF